MPSRLSTRRRLHGVKNGCCEPSARANCTATPRAPQRRTADRPGMCRRRTLPTCPGRDVTDCVLPDAKSKLDQ
jgi:hypothetical protein